MANTEYTNSDDESDELSEFSSDLEEYLPLEDGEWATGGLGSTT